MEFARFMTLLSVFPLILILIHKETAKLFILKLPSPYMDEIFHIKQSQHYHKGNFTMWDNKITTFPGLYLLSLGYSFVLSILTKKTYEECFDTKTIRSINSVIAILVYFVVYFVLEEIQYLNFRAKFKTEEKNNKSYKFSYQFMLLAFNVSLFPLNFFFSFLYYTDLASLLFVLLTYLFTLLSIKYQGSTFKTSYSLVCFLSGLFASMAIAVRQTNVIWGIFCVLCHLQTSFTHFKLNNIVVHHKNKSINAKLSTIGTLDSIHKDQSNIFNLKYWISYGKTIYTCSKVQNKGYSNIDIYIIFTILKDTFSFLTQGCTSLFIPIILFIAWVPYNGSIVVGDKKAHTVAFNFPQIFHFALFTTLFALPSTLLPFISLVLTSIRQKKKFLLIKTKGYFIMVTCLGLLLCIISYCAIHFFTYQHPYLLADNRHITFYVWRRLLYPFKFALIPIYWFCFYLIYLSLTNSKFAKDDQSRCKSFVNNAWLTSFILSTMVVLIPQGFLEFRYFMIPYVMLRLHQNLQFHTSSRVLLLLIMETFYYLFINMLTLRLLCTKEIYWTDTPDVHRLMW